MVDASKAVAAPPARPPLPKPAALAFRVIVISGLCLLVFLLGGVILAAALYRPMWPKFWPTITSPDTVRAIRLTLITTVVTTCLGVAIGTPAAYTLSRYRVPLSTLVDTIIDLPIVLPPLTAGVCLLIAFQTPLGHFFEEHIARVVFTPKGIILAQFFPTVGFCTRSLKAAFDSVDPRLESVARTLGCTEVGAFRRVVFPLARNGMLAGAMMTWARSVGIFGPIIMFCGTTRGKTEVLSISVFLNMSSNRIEEGLSIALLMVIMAILVLLAFRRLGGRGYLW